MFRTLINAFKNKEIRNKLLITIALLFLYRIGCWLPVPGIDREVFSYVDGNNTLLSLLSAITGRALANGAILALGISPYINASIIVQLLGAVIPSLEKLTKQGEEGRKKLNTITRYVTLALAVMQAIGITVAWANAGGLSDSMYAGTVFSNQWVVGGSIVIMLVAGAMFSTWLGERITELGVGNGISLLIFIGILATADLSLIANINSIIQGTDEYAIWSLLGFIVMAVVIFGLIVFVDLAERRIPIQYAKQIKGRKQYGGQNTYIPIKVNASGVMPIIFASAIITFPQMLGQIFWPNHWLHAWWMKYMGVNTWPYAIIMALLILLFSYVYASMQFKPDEVARNLQQYGGFIPGTRPGKPTYDYINKISKRITLFGAIYLAFIALIPGLLFSFFSFGNSSLVNSMTATGMLIIVSVGLEVDKQLQSLMMMKQYKGFLK